jgi:hypothetical protein
MARRIEFRKAQGAPRISPYQFEMLDVADAKWIALQRGHTPMDLGTLDRKARDRPEREFRLTFKGATIEEWAGGKRLPRRALR